jgi:hypothetical protein
LVVASLPYHSYYYFLRAAECNPFLEDAFDFVGLAAQGFRGFAWITLETTLLVLSVIIEVPLSAPYKPPNLPILVTRNS